MTTALTCQCQNASTISAQSAVTERLPDSDKARSKMTRQRPGPALSHQQLAPVVTARPQHQPTPVMNASASVIAGAGAAAHLCAPAGTALLLRPLLPPLLLPHCWPSRLRVACCPEDCCSCCNCRCHWGPRCCHARCLVCCCCRQHHLGLPSAVQAFPEAPSLATHRHADRLRLCVHSSNKQVQTIQHTRCTEWRSDKPPNWGKPISCSLQVTGGS